MTPLEATQQDALLAIKALLTQPYDGDNLPRDIVAIVDAVAKPSSPDESKLTSFRAKAGWRFRDKGKTNHEWTEEDWRDWYESIGQCLYRIAERKHGAQAE